MRVARRGIVVAVALLLAGCGGGGDGGGGGDDESAEDVTTTTGSDDGEEVTIELHVPDDWSVSDDGHAAVSIVLRDEERVRASILVHDDEVGPVLFTVDCPAGRFDELNELLTSIPGFSR